MHEEHKYILLIIVYVLIGLGIRTFVYKVVSSVKSSTDIKQTKIEYEEIYNERYKKFMRSDDQNDVIINVEILMNDLAGAKQRVFKWI